MNDLFINHLTLLLNEHKAIDKDTRDKAIQLIKNYYTRAEIRKRGLLTKGPCVMCEKIEINYEIPLDHLAKLDGILPNLRRKFGGRTARNISIEVNKHGKCPTKLNGYNATSIWGYFCSDCVQELSQAIVVKGKEEKERREAESEKEEKAIKAILVGELKVSPTKGFHALYHLSDKSIEKQRDMPYDEFLKTNYWNLVRRYKLHKAKYRCQLCSLSGKSLNVHHKTYDHRGIEHRHLDDLIVLCRECHAKFHDKMPA